MSKREEKFSGCYIIARWLACALFHTIFPVRYHNRERAQMDAPYLLIGNHNSMLDPLIVGWPCERYQIRFLGKRELAQSSLLRRMFKNLRMIAVDRHNMDLSAVRACLKTLKDGHVLGVFPEGTRHKRGVMEELESGVGMIALRGDVPILPVYITGKARFLRRVDCYYGEPFSVSELAAGGVNREACGEVLRIITAKYRDMVAEYGMTVQADE